MSERKDHIEVLRQMRQEYVDFWKEKEDCAYVKALDFAINSLEVDEAYQLEYEKASNSKKCACYYCEHFEREGWSHCKIHEGTYGDARCNDYKELKHKETVTEFADRCQECGKTIKQRYILNELKEIREEIFKDLIQHSGTGEEVIQAYCDGLIHTLYILDKKISELEGKDENNIRE